MLLGYLAVTSVLALLRLPSQPVNRWVLVANLLMAAAVTLLARSRLSRAGEVLRSLFPLFLLGALYPAIDILNNFGAVAVHDATVRGWEVALFGMEPSRVWWQRSHSMLWSTVFHAAYFGFYPIIAATPITLLARGRQRAAERSVTWIFATFLLCYVVFLIFPVAGPYYEFPRPDPWFLDNPAARLVYATLASGSAFGAAFPSSHVAATLVAVAAAFLGSPRLGWVLLVPAVLLTIGVVYCQMHYAVDAVAGVGLAASVVGVGSLLEKRSSEFRVPSEPTRRASELGTRN
ncbi:MAG TPA: phosphatase PAP2 family protein [Gemmatimonadales bacterium]|nr:phosphatase PAP2 family protein [Gemmatimonadales bacterium]